MHRETARQSPFKITVTESVVINRSPEAVWDFTQDHQRRKTWDPSVREATVIADTPTPRVQVRFAGGIHAILQYKQFDRPRQTSLSMEGVRSPLAVGGGGSWTYAAHAAGTQWTATNTLVLKSGLWSRLLVPLFRHQLASSTRRAMQRAKQLLEMEAR